MTDDNKKALLDWDALIQDYCTSGLTDAVWCQEHGVKIHQLRWQITKRQKLNKKSQSIQWVSLQVNSSVPAASITVKIGSVEVAVTEGFNKGLFAEVVHSLLTLC